METPKYISHLRKNDELSDKWMFQSNEEHSKGVAKFAASFLGNNTDCLKIIPQKTNK